MLAVAFLGELNIDTRRLGRQGSQLHQPIRGRELTVLQLQALRLHQAEQLFDHPSRLIPFDDLPGFGRISDFMRGQQAPVQRLDISGRGDFPHFNRAQPHRRRQTAILLMTRTAELHLAKSSCTVAPGSHKDFQDKRCGNGGRPAFSCGRAAPSAGIRGRATHFFKAPRRAVREFVSFVFHPKAT